MAVKTDNRFLNSKVNLRVQLLPEIHPLNVLDCFHGDGTVWKSVIKRSGRNDISVTGIDMKEIPGVLNGDNRRWLRTLELSMYGVVDLDAYGSPFDQIDILVERGYSGVVFFTWCKNLGSLPMVLKKYCSSPWCDIGLSESILSAYLNDKGVGQFSIVKHRKAGGFNFYGEFTLGGQQGLS